MTELLADTVNDFILEYAPGVEQERLFRGYFNRAALPPKEDYTIYTLAATERRGTNVDEWGRDEVRTRALRQYVYDIDFCHVDQEVAQKRAVAIATVGRCYKAVGFFAERGACFNYAGDATYLPYVDMTEQYIHRYRVSIFITVWDELALPQDFADTVTAKVENIDAHHPPKRE